MTPRMIVKKITGDIIGIVTLPELLEAGRTVDLRRVIQLGGDSAQTGEVDDHARPDPPDGHDHEGGIDPADVEQPLGQVLPAEAAGTR